MGILATAQWWVRADGDALNGGGFDAAIAGAGTNYCDQAAAQLSLTDLATPGAGSTTLTSATGGFTAAMNGNCWRIPSGTNFQAGYYFQTGFTDANTITLDRTPTSGGAGSGGTGRLGGAFATPWGNLAATGTFTAPTIATPVAPGHVVWVQGPGDDDPATPTYTGPEDSWFGYPAGSAAAGRISVRGYNGRPSIKCGMSFYGQALLTVRGIKFVATSTALGWGVYPLVLGNNPALCALIDCIVDQDGYDKAGTSATFLAGCAFRNSGGGAVGSNPALKRGASTVAQVVDRTTFDEWRGSPVMDFGQASGNHMYYLSLRDVSITRSGGAGLRTFGFSEPGGAIYLTAVQNCTFALNAGDAIVFDGNTTYDAVQGHGVLIRNCIFSENGGWAVVIDGTTVINDAQKVLLDGNAFFDNASGDISGATGGANDIALSADPFTDGANGDFTLNNAAGGGALLRGAAFPDF